MSLQADRGPEQVLSLLPGSLLAVFNRAGALSAADVHVARRLCRLAEEHDEQVALAAALAVRAPRFGHVLVDLKSVATTLAGLEEGGAVDAATLPWPDPATWTERLSLSPLVSVAGQEGPSAPLCLDGTALYLARYWQEEAAVAEDLVLRARAGAPAVDQAVLEEGLGRLFPGGSGQVDEQAEAARAILGRQFSVLAGGPGTGKTTTVARVLALLEEQALAMGHAPPLVALAAPTGKAAARMAEAVHEEAARMDVAEPVRRRLESLGASTVHRLLGRLPGTSTGFRHDRYDRLPHDVVVVDETSMMSLSLMASLLGAVRPRARLVLVGDPEQLASVEAGAVLGDIVAARAESGPAYALDGDISVLRTNRRFSGPLAELSEAVRSGHSDRALGVLRAGAEADGDGCPVRWLAVDAALASSVELGPLRQLVLGCARKVTGAASSGDGPRALAAAGELRVLCAHRDGPVGASTWNAYIEQWLADDGRGATAPLPTGRWYAGRPVLVTANDYATGVFNGDLGVTVRQADGSLTVAFGRPSDAWSLSPARLSAVETAYAMTAHRAQGSEFDEVVVLLPDAASPVLTRELLYTAITRARRGLLVVGLEGSLRAAIDRPVARATGLGRRLVC